MAHLVVVTQFLIGQFKISNTKLYFYIFTIYYKHFDILDVEKLKRWEILSSFQFLVMKLPKNIASGAKKVKILHEKIKFYITNSIWICFVPNTFGPTVPPSNTMMQSIIISKQLSDTKWHDRLSVLVFFKNWLVFRRAIYRRIHIYWIPRLWWILPRRRPDYLFEWRWNCGRFWTRHQEWRWNGYQHEEQHR